VRYWPVRLNGGREISLLKGRACAYPELDPEDLDGAIQLDAQVNSWLETHRNDPRYAGVQEWLDLFEDEHPSLSIKMPERQKRKTAVEIASKHSPKRS
jgi:hypothetical protein